MERPIFQRTHIALLILAAFVLVVAGITGTAISSSGEAEGLAPVGQPPPELAANAGAWPAQNYDLSNTRATTQSPITSQTVLAAEGEVDVRLQGRERLRHVCLDADLLQRNRLSPGPEFEHVRARPARRSGRRWRPPAELVAYSLP